MRNRATNAIQLNIDSTESQTNYMSLAFNGKNIFIPLKKFTKRQEHALSRMNDTDKLSYLLTFLPKTNAKSSHIRKAIGRPQQSIGFDDPLRSRSKNHYLYKFQEMCGADSPKTPKSLDFHFGIEIECFIPYDSVDATSNGTCECYNCDGRGTVTCTDANDNEYENECMTCDGSGEVEDDDSENNSSDALNNLKDLIKKNHIRGCHVKTDGSIEADDDHFGVEIAVLTTDFKNVKLLCALLNKLDAKVNQSCGLHVHLDARNMQETIEEPVQRTSSTSSRDQSILTVINDMREREYTENQISSWIIGQAGGRSHNEGSIQGRISNLERILMSNESNREFICNEIRHMQRANFNDDRSRNAWTVGYVPIANLDYDSRIQNRYGVNTPTFRISGTGITNISIDTEEPIRDYRDTARIAIEAPRARSLAELAEIMSRNMFGRSETSHPEPQETRKITQLKSNIKHNLGACLDVLFEILPKSRSKSSYCKKTVSTSDRYSAVNLTSLNKFNTVEIRAHSGTTDFKKIYNWCMVLKGIVDKTDSVERVTSVTNLCEQFGLSDELKRWMLERRRKFNDDDNDAQDEESA